MGKQRYFSITHIGNYHDMDPNRSNLYISMCPGRKDHRYQCDLMSDLDFIRNQGIDVVISLLQDYELTKLQISDYRECAEQSGLIYYNFPIIDGNVPSNNGLYTIINTIREHMDVGHNVLVHCKCGLGRAGTICAAVFIYFGYSSQESISLIRSLRPGAIQTQIQERLLEDYGTSVIDSAVLSW